MSKSRRQLLVLVALGLVLGFLVYSNPFGQTVPQAPPSNGTSVESTKPTRGAQTAAKPGSTGVTDVKLDLLTADAGDFASPQRDPFHFKAKPAPPPPVSVPRPAPPVTLNAAPPPPPLTDTAEQVIKYVGYMVSQSGAKVAAIQYSPRNSPTSNLAGSEGSNIEGRFRLLRVEPDAIEVTDLAGDGRRSRIPRSK